MTHDVVGAALERADQVRRPRRGTEDDHRGVGGDGEQRGVAVAQSVDQREGLAVDVDQDQVCGGGAQVCERGGVVSDGIDGEPVGGEVVVKERAGGLVLVGEQDANGGRCHHGGLRFEVAPRGLAATGAGFPGLSQPARAATLPPGRPASDRPSRA